MYRERMNSYYPQAIQSILEFQAIIDSEYPEFETIFDGTQRVISDAYLTTMSEDRIEQWENMLGIHPIEGSSVSDRRETIIARIRGQGKLNTELIKTIVKTFTGGDATARIEDGVLCVEIALPPNNKQFQFSNVEQELKHKVPAHLELRVSRDYYNWDEIDDNCSTWTEIRNTYATWYDVLYNIPGKDNQLGITKFDEFVLR